MTFKYHSVTTKPDNVQFFSDANPVTFNFLVDWWKAQPGFISGTWAVNPDNPNEFITDHSWTSKAAWVEAATKSLTLNETRQVQEYALANNLYTLKDFSEE